MTLTPKGRMDLKRQCVVDRVGGDTLPCPCDYCQKVDALDMHEMISRGKVPITSNARELIFNPKVCALLCRECHEKWHNNSASEMRPVLWRFLAEIYGDIEISRHIQQIIDGSKFKADVEFEKKQYQEAIHERTA